MDPERRRQVEALCAAALEREPAARDAFLEEACRSDAELRPILDDLLARADGFLESPLLAGLRDGTAAGAGAGRIPPGTALGPYTIEAFVGAGGMGEVYRARDVRLHRTVAVKILRPVRSESGDTAEVTTRLEDGGTTVNVRRRFETEARAASALDHPNICTIYDIGEQHGLCFIAMEWIDGGTIGDLMPSSGLPVEQAFGLARQVVDGIAAAHRVGIVHRDIKPANILVTSSGAAKIVDFGLAKVSVPGIGAGGMAPGEVAAVPRVEGPVATTTTM